MHAGRRWALLVAGVLASLSFAALAADGRPVREPLQPVLSGTVHQALFALAFDGPLGLRSAPAAKSRNPPTAARAGDRSALRPRGWRCWEWR